MSDVVEPLDYVREAIDKYWAESKLELSITVALRPQARAPLS